MFTVCASQVESQSRIEHLQAMLWSLEQGSLHIPLIMSIGCVDSALAQSLGAVLQRVQVSMQTHLAFTLDHKHSTQMHRLRSLIVTLPDDCWICFTDDDDLHHPLHCSQLYSLAMNARQSYPCEVYAVCGVYANGRRDDVLLTTTQVTNAIKQCSVSLHRQQSTQEMWQIVIPMRFLKDFCDASPASIIEHPFADQFFIKYLKGTEAIMLDPADEISWAYYYRNTEGSAATSATPRMSDRLLRIITAINREVAMDQTVLMAIGLVIDCELHIVASMATALDDERTFDLIRFRIKDHKIQRTVLQLANELGLSQEVAESATKQSRFIDGEFVVGQILRPFVDDIWLQDPYYRALFDTSNRKDNSERIGTICACCKKPCAKLQCSCRKTYYCGTECQKQHVVGHRAIQQIV